MLVQDESINRFQLQEGVHALLPYDDRAYPSFNSTDSVFDGLYSEIIAKEIRPVSEQLLRSIRR